VRPTDGDRPPKSEELRVIVDGAGDPARVFLLWRPGSGAAQRGIWR
jgi:hypothetical protein